jgi:branched-chain amino acid transport system permease protein
MDAIVSGLVLGGLYALVGQGFVLTYITTRTINFAAGEMLALGAFVAIGVGSWGWLPTPGKFGLVIVLMGVVGGLTYRLLIVPFAHSEHDTRWILSTVGLSFVLLNLLTNAQGASPRRLDLARLDGTSQIAGVTLTRQSLLTAAIAVLVAIAVAAVTRWTPGGLLMRAVAEDAQTVSLMGVSPRMVGMAAYATATAIAGGAGVLWGAEVGVTPSLGVHVLVAGFAVSVIGGLTSRWGPLAGAALFSVVVQVISFEAGSLWGQVAGLVLVIVVLIVRPEGLLGRRLEAKL